MASVSLYDYLESINQLLDEESYAEVERHCRHILAQYPRHIETYRLLARAFLARLQYSQAIDLLQRALSADPNDFITHIALSDAYRGDGRSGLALYHLQRAFELTPYKSAIQDELRRVYGEAGEVALATERLSLTPAAAAYLNLQGELYQPAVTILRDALQQEPDRVELELLLAEALWRNGSRVEAASLCTRILDVLPDSIVANAILSEVWQGAARTAEALPYLRRLHSLTLVDKQHVDVETVVGAALMAQGGALLPDKLTVEPLEFSGKDVLASEAESRWSEKKPPAPAADVVDSDGGDIYGWLSGVADATSDAAASIPSAETGDDKPETDWFVDAALEESRGADDPSQSVSDWLEGEWEEPDEAQLPDRMDDYLQAPLPPLTASDAGLEPFMGKDDDAFPDIDEPEIPSWLTSGLESEETIESSPAEQPSEDGMPDWLAAITSTDFNAVQLDPDSASQWLSEEEAGDAADEPSESEAEAADWLASLSGHIDEMQEPEEEEAAVLNSDWLSVDSEPEPAADWLHDESDEPAEADSGAEWLNEIVEDDAEAIWGEDWLQDEASAAPVEEPAAASETDWLARLSQETEEAADAGDWLAELAMDAADEAGELDEPEAVSQPPLAQDDADEDWLADLSTGLTDELADAVAAWSDDSKAPAEVELGDWLDDLADGAADEPVDEDTAVAPAESLEDDSDDLEDWLADLSRPTGELSELELPEEEDLFTAPQETGAAAPMEATGAEAAGVVPDWLSGAEDEYLNVEAERMGVHDENDVPEQEQTPEPDKEQERQAHEDKEGLDAQTLPDEREEAAETAVDAAETPPELTTGDLPDWLSESAPSFSQEGENEDIDVPDWLLESTSDLMEVSETLAPAPDELSADAPELPGLTDWLSDDWISDLDSDSVEEEEEEDGLPQMEEFETPPAPPTSLLEELTPDAAQLPEDDDLDWLGQLAEDDTAEEALPALDWLSELDVQEPQVVEEADTAVSPAHLPESDEAGDDVDEEDDEEDLFSVPADLDDAMSWLEDLAAEQNAPVEPLPTVAEILDDEAEMTEVEADVAAPREEALTAETPDEGAVAASIDEAMVDLDDTLTWLDDLTEEAGALDEASLDLLAEDEEAFDESEADVPELPVELTADAEPTPDMVTDVPEDLEEAMAWLESLAARQGAPLDELPSLSQQEAPVDLDEDEQAVDQLDDDVDETAPAAADDAPEGAPEGAPDVASELDEALDWLDDLAAGDTALEEWDVEPKAEEEEALADTAVSAPETAATDTAEDAELSEADEALFAELDWLEAVTFGASMPADEAVDEVAGLAFEQPSDDELSAALERLALMPLPDEAPSEMPAVEAEVEETAVAELPPVDAETEDFDDFDAIFDIPDDPDEAMAWLQEFAGEESDEPQPPAPEMLAAEDAVAEMADYADVEPVGDFLADVPEDPDEAMAWLEQLAARQGASLDELPTVTEVPQEVETPRWVASAAKAAAEESAAEAAAEPVSDVAPDAPRDDDNVPDPFDFELPDEEEDTAEWMRVDEYEGAADDELFEQPDWLDSLPEMDVTGWLESEEAASTAPGGDTGPLPQTGPLFESKPATGPLTEPEAVDEPEMAAAERPAVERPAAERPAAELPATSILQVDEDQLERARAALAAGASTDAVAAYQQLVAKGEGLMTLIGELETAVEQHRAEPTFRRLLGDAYMRNGQLQKALSTYRDALDQL